MVGLLVCLEFDYRNSVSSKINLNQLRNLLDSRRVEAGGEELAEVVDGAGDAQADRFDRVVAAAESPGNAAGEAVAAANGIDDASARRNAATCGRRSPAAKRG